jgi:hypothetical protein
MNKKELEKSSLIDALLEDESITKDTYIFCLEHHKISDAQGFLKFQVLNSEKQVVFNFKILQDLTDPNMQNVYNKIRIGDKKATVGLIQLESKSFFQIIKEGAETAVKEGRLPFIPGQ